MINLLQFLSIKLWMLEAFSVIFMALVFSYLERRAYRKLRGKLKKTKKIWSWEGVFLEALHPSLHSGIWFLGIVFAADIVAANVPGIFLFQAIQPLRQLGIIVLLVWFIIRFIYQIEIYFVQKGHELPEDYVDATTVQVLSKLIRAAVLITAGLIGLQILGIPISGVLAFGGVGALAVGLAAKDMLANFFGGLMIFLDRPFRIGDWIRSPDKMIEGTVEDIGWRLTCIRTFDKRPLYVPNSLFLTIALENPSRMRNRRIKTVVGVRYQDADKITDLLKDIEGMLRQHPDIDTRQTLFVKLIEFGPSSLKFFALYIYQDNRLGKISEHTARYITKSAGPYQSTWGRMCFSYIYTVPSSTQCRTAS